MVLEVNNPPTSVGDARDTGSIPTSGRSPGGEHGNPLQYACLDNPTDRGAWWATVHRVAESGTTEWLRHTHCKHGISNVLLTVQVSPFANGSDFSRNKFVIGKDSHWVFMRNLSNSRNIQKCLRPEISQVMYIHWGGAVRDLLWEWGKYWSSYLYLLLKYHLLISMCFIICVILFSSRMY